MQSCRTTNVVVLVWEPPSASGGRTGTLGAAVADAVSCGARADAVALSERVPGGDLVDR